MGWHGEWHKLVGEKKGMLSYHLQDMSCEDEDNESSLMIAKRAAQDGNEGAFHMFFKLAQLEHYIRRDTPRTRG